MKDSNDQLAREMFLCLAGRYRNITVKEKEEVDHLLKEGVTEKKVNFGCGKLYVDPILWIRMKRALQEHGDVAIDVTHSILCGFPEDGLNEELSEEEKKLLIRDFGED